MRHLLVLGLYFCSGQFRDGCCVLRSDMLEDALRDVAALRRERRAFRSALVEVLRGAFELADAGGDGDGEVSMEECLRLDAEIAVRATAKLDLHISLFGSHYMLRNRRWLGGTSMRRGPGPRSARWT